MSTLAWTNIPTVALVLSGSWCSQDQGRFLFHAALCHQTDNETWAKYTNQSSDPHLVGTPGFLCCLCLNHVSHSYLKARVYTIQIKEGNVGWHFQNTPNHRITEC